MLTLNCEVAYNLEIGNDLSMRVETSQIKLFKIALALIFFLLTYWYRPVPLQLYQYAFFLGIFCLISEVTR